MSIAIVLATWRPFLSQSWAALRDEGSDAPPQCAWTEQITSSLCWIKFFLAQQEGSTERMFSLPAVLKQGRGICIITDACGSGMGGVLFGC